MSFKLGKNHICDACGETVFLEHISFSPKPDTYEHPPEGWIHFDELGDLCPNCAARLCINLIRIFGSNVPKKFHRTTDPESEKLNEYYTSFIGKIEPYETYTNLLKQSAVIFPEEKKNENH